MILSIAYSGMATQLVAYLAQKTLGRVLWVAGHSLRLAASRVTSEVIRKEYAFGGAPESLSHLLASIAPADFGGSTETVFVSASCCHEETEAFLEGTLFSHVPVEIKHFHNGEIYTRIEETVRNKKVVIVQDFGGPGNVNDKIMETLLLIDAAKRASAKEVVLVCHSFPYLNVHKSSNTYKIDYFKLMLGLFFKSVGLDELRLGAVTVNRHRNILNLQDDMVDDHLVPFLFANADALLSRKLDVPVDDLVFCFGRAYSQQAESIVAKMETRHAIRGRVSASSVQSFSAPTNEMYLSLGPGENLKNKRVYVFQTCNTGSTNTDLIEALLMVYRAKKAGAREVVVVMPLLPYNRQERKAKPREPISAKVVANALVQAGATQIVTIDLHAAATQGFVDIPFQHVTTFGLVVGAFKKIIAGEIPNWAAEKPAVGSPDLGRAKHARWLGLELFGAKAATIVVDKERPRHGVARLVAVVGNPKGKDIFLFDDLIDSAGSIIAAAEALVARGAKRIYFAATHGVLSDVYIKFNKKNRERDDKAWEEFERIKAWLTGQGKRWQDFIKVDEKGFMVNALIRLQACPHLSGVIFTDTIDVPKKNIIDTDKVKTLSVVNLLAAVCSRIIKGESLEDYQHEREHNVPT